MKTIELNKNPVTIDQLLELASRENVVLRKNGEEFIVAIVDDFDAEVECLRHSKEFLAFLDARAKENKVSLDSARNILLE